MNLFNAMALLACLASISAMALAYISGGPSRPGLSSLRRHRPTWFQEPLVAANSRGREITTVLEPDGRLPIGAECFLSDGRPATVIRRSPIRDAMTLMKKDGRNSFRSIRIYDATLKTANGQKVRQERIRIDEPDKPIPPHGSRRLVIGTRAICTKSAGPLEWLRLTFGREQA